MVGPVSKTNEDFPCRVKPDPQWSCIAGNPWDHKRTMVETSKDHTKWKGRTEARVDTPCCRAARVKAGQL